MSGYLKHASDHQSGLFPFAWHYLWEHFLNNFPQIFPVIFPINHHGKFILSYSKFISYLLFCIYSTLNKDLHSFIHSYLFIKSLVFVILSGLFPISSWFTRLLQIMKSIYFLFYWWDLLLLFCFLYNRENLYMMHRNWDLFNDIYNTVTEHNQRQIHYLSSILNYFDIYF